MATNSEFDNLLIEQRITIERLGRVLVNYRKGGKEKYTVVKTSFRLEELHRCWTRCQELNVKLQQIATEEQKKTSEYFTNDEFVEAEAVFEDHLDKLSELLNALSPSKPSAESKIPDLSFKPEALAFSMPLPKIQLPTFSGRLTEWESFRDLFSALVISHEGLSAAQRLHYLKTAVTGNASVLIENVPISDANFESAWKILTDEFDNPRLLIHAHIQAFAEFPAMRTENQYELKQFRDLVNSSITALTNLKRPVREWDDWLVYVISQKFSPRTRQEWNLHLGASTTAPTFKQIITFMTQRIRGLGDPIPDSNRSGSKPIKTNHNKLAASVHTTSSNNSCFICSNAHPLWRCNVFRRYNLDDRFKVAKENKVCFNCLRAGHYPTNCPSQTRCNKCQRAHHSLLHRGTLTNANVENPRSDNRQIRTYERTENSRPAMIRAVPLNASTTNTSAISPGASPSQSIGELGHTHATSCNSIAGQPPSIILPTAWVLVRTEEGYTMKVRALIDQGSVYSFISETLAQALHTKRYKAALHITGFGETYSGSVRSRLSLSIEPCHGQGPTLPMTAYVFPKLTAYTNSQIRSIGHWTHLANLELADPLASREAIHMLIGADLYGHILLNEIRQGPVGTPTAQLTIFGWILSGPTDNPTTSSCQQASVLNCVTSIHLDESLLRQFWETEEVSIKLPFNDEDQACEDHFTTTHSRMIDGRYVVKLPFKNSPPVHIGDSFSSASLLYKKLEQRLGKNYDLSNQYTAFLSEYLGMGHMERISELDSPPYNPVYIPHHPVVRESSATTRLRVVFNASHKTSNGTSLNDHLLSGPKLQEDLSSVLLRWRLGRFVYTADIEKMFRQIAIHDSDKDYQRILWRCNKDEPVASFRLKTVTYGTVCAPYLALRVLQQLATDEGSSFPYAVPILRKCKYVDDLLISGHDETYMLEAFRQINALLERGGFHLRKWASNSTDLLKVVPDGEHELAMDRSLGDQDSLKILGLVWLPQDDHFKFKIIDNLAVRTTKRSILSFLARLFDPLGWAAPVTIIAKILIQDLWLAQIGWDDDLPSDLLQQWTRYYSQFHILSTLKIPRWTGYSPDISGLELHGFADASSRAYSAAVYLRLIFASEDIKVCLLTAKTKVAPVKTLSIPRLELQATVLLTKLLYHVVTSLELSEAPTYGWTDSTVVLAWLKQHPTRWSTFVANRVSEVQTRLPNLKWRHVPTASNPADCATRGITAEELSQHTLWWTGPSWLHHSSLNWPTQPQVSSESLTAARSELKKTAVCQVTAPEEWDVFLRVSSWSKLLRATAYIHCFVRFKFFNYVQNYKLTPTDLQEARNILCRYIQRQSFPVEIQCIQRNTPLKGPTPLRSLHPFMGNDHLLRLGGRLRRAELPFERRFPIILPRHRFTELLIETMHLRSLHGGTQLTLNLLRQQFWVLGARSAVKSQIHRCIPCVRERAAVPKQLMGELPPARINPSPPFSHTGVDYAGPFSILLATGRGQKPRKYWVAIFVCLATKAVHLEFVDDSSTPGFLAAFRRFASRRGVPSDMYSDHGTNFQGASRELQRTFRIVTKDPYLHDQLRNDGTAWHFIPAAAPHFGGLWEAAVRRFKHHLRRVVGDHHLTILEFSSLLSQIEACLNSRPLRPLSDDPSDLDVLTPGHFLIGRPLLSVPEPSRLKDNLNGLTHWFRVQAMRDRFWKTWQTEYLHTLHQRHKWQRECPNLSVGELVLLRSPHLPPSKWDRARVLEVHPGPDGLVRVATLRTAHSTVKRPIAQIVRLPVKCTI